MKPVGFDWDDDKSAANLAKHLVSFEEAMSGFDIRLPAADMSGRKTVKKNETAEGSDEMRPHYDFDDSKSIRIVLPVARSLSRSFRCP
jgi:uncharacterized DUF497 family protein